MEKIKDKSGSFPYEMGLLSYVPFIGIIFGIVSIIWSPLTRRIGSKVPTLLGLGGIVVNLILIGMVYYGSTMGGLHRYLLLKINHFRF